MKTTTCIRALALLCAALLVAAMIAAVALPATASGGYTEGLGGMTSYELTKYLVMKDTAQIVPTVTFNYTIEAGEAAEEEGILAGVGEITAEPISFTSASSTVKFGESGAVGVPGLTNGQMFATGKTTLDFSAAGFKDVGIYRYKVTETATEEGYITDDANATKTLDVYVEKSGENQLSIGGYTMSNPDAKVNSFVNTYETYSLGFGVEIAGNQASINQYFKIDLSITDCGVDGTYTVNLSNADKGEISSQGNASNPSAIVISDGAGSSTFYARGGQGIEIVGLPKGTSYSVSQTAVDGYTTSPESPQSGSLTEDKDITFSNTKEGTVPTGVLMVVAPFLALAAVGAVGAVIILRKRRKEKD